MELQLKDQVLRLKEKSLTAGFDQFLAMYYARQGKEIEITAAKRTDDPDTHVTTVTGLSTFLQVAKLPVKAQFGKVAEDEVRASLCYTLIDETTSSSRWKFSKSFPDLPVSDESDKSLLDTLLFSKAEVVVTTHPFTHQEYGIELESGINFVGKIRPSGMTGIVSHLSGTQSDVVIHGRINLPADSTQLFIPELAVDQTKAKTYPWEMSRELPGIHLQASISSSFKVGSTEFKDGTLRLYSPLEYDWMENSDFYQPTLGLTGSVEIEKGSLSIDLIGEAVPGQDAMFFEARLDGFSIANLSKLAGVSGNSDLLSSFPSPLKKIVKEVSKIELTDFAFGIATSKKEILVSMITFEVGIPDASYVLWKDHLTLSNLGSRFTLNSPFKSPSFDITFWGTSAIEGVPVRLLASNTTGWTFMASMQDSKTIPLGKLLKSYVPTVDAPADLTVDNLMVVVDPAKAMRLMASFAESPGWAMQLGSEKLKIADVKLDVSVTTSGSVNGSFRGTAALGGLSLEMNYTIPGDFVIRSECDEITLQGLSKRFTGSKKLVPSGFNPKVKQSTLLIKKDGNGLVMQVGGTVSKDTFVFEAKKSSSGWGYAAGMQLEDPRLSKIPGLEGLKALEKVIQMENLTMVVASYAARDFRFPNTGAFSNPTLSSHNMPMPAQAGGLQAGLNFYGSWKIDTSKKEMKLLKKMLGLDPEVDVTLQVSQQPQKSSRIFVAYETTVNKNWPLNCQLGFGMVNGTPEFFLTGSLIAKIQKQPCTFDVAMSLVQSGMYLGGTMKGTVKFQDLSISNLALMFGMNWGGIPTLGVAGMLNFPNFSGSVAILFDANNPGKSLLAGSISDLSLLDIFTDIANAKSPPKNIAKALDNIGFEGTKPFTMPASCADALDNQDLSKVAPAFKKNGAVTLSTASDQVMVITKKKGSSWHVTDMANNMTHYQLTKTSKGIRVTLDTQLYVAPEPTQIGTLQFNQGFFLNGTLNILGLKWTSMVNINPRKGIAVDTYTNKALVIYKKQFFALSDLEGKKGPRLSLSTYNQPKASVPEFRKPHFYLNGRIAFLGLEVAKTFVEITEHGFKFDIEQNRGLSIGCSSISATVAAGFKLNGSFDSIQNFDAGGGVTLLIKGKVSLGKLMKLGKAVPALDKMGTIQLNLGAKGELDVGHGKTKTFAKFEGSFVFQKSSFSFQKNLSVNDKSLEKIADVVYDEIKDALKELINTAEEWVEAVGKGLIEGVKEIEKVGEVLKDVYGKTAEDAAKLLHNVGKEFDEIGKALNKAYKQSTKDVAKTLKKVGAEAEDVAKALSKAFNSSANQVATVLKQVGEHPDKIARALNKQFKQGARDVAKTLSQVGIDTNQIAGTLKSVFKQPSKQMAQTLKAIGQTPDKIAGALKSTFNQTAKQAARTLSDIKCSADDIGKALKNTFKLSANGMAQTMKDIGKSSSQIAGALSKNFRQSANQTAKVLNSIGVGMDDVAGAMKSVFKQSSGDVAKTLKSIGKTPNQIAGVLSRSFRLKPQDAAKVLFSIGSSVDDVGGALKSVFKSSGNDAAKIFKNLGKPSKDVARVLKGTFRMSAKDVGNTLKSVFKLNKKDLQSVLKGVGFASKEVSKFVGNAAKSIKKFFHF